MQPFNTSLTQRQRLLCAMVLPNTWTAQRCVTCGRMSPPVPKCVRSDLACHAGVPSTIVPENSQTSRGSFTLHCLCLLLHPALILFDYAKAPQKTPSAASTAPARPAPITPAVQPQPRGVMLGQHCHVYAYATSFSQQVLHSQSQSWTSWRDSFPNQPIFDSMFVFSGVQSRH